MDRNSLRSWAKSLRRPGRHSVVTLVLLAVAALAAHLYESWQAGSLDVSGTARVVDGDSLFIGAREVRLEGIDAPEGPQNCSRGGRDWPCGEAASRELRKLTLGHTVACSGPKEDKHGRLLGTCRAAGRDLNSEMVSRGFAVSYGRYKSEERRARAEARGIWAGTFQRPREWRRARDIGR